MPIGLSRPRILVLCGRSEDRVLHQLTRRLRAALHDQLITHFQVLPEKDSDQFDIEINLGVFVLGNNGGIDIGLRIAAQALKGVQVAVLATKDMPFLEEFKEDLRSLACQYPPRLIPCTDLVSDGMREIPPYARGIFHPDLPFPRNEPACVLGMSVSNGLFADDDMEQDVTPTKIIPTGLADDEC